MTSGAVQQCFIYCTFAVNIIYCVVYMYCSVTTNSCNERYV